MFALLSFPMLVRKLVTFAVLPLGIVLLLLLVAFAFRKRWMIAAAGLVLYLSSVPLVGDHLVGALEGQYPRLRVEVCPAADAIVVLGGVVADWDGGKRVEWSEAVDRFEGGVQLWKAGKAPVLVIGGGELDYFDDGSTEGDAMRQAAEERGVSGRAIRVLRDVSVTADEARRTAELARQEGWRRLILVTSAFHMPRAMRLFARSGLEVVPFPVDYLGHTERPFELLDLAPQANALVHTEVALKEFYGLLYYRLGAVR